MKKTALVVGGTSGLGLEIAQLLLPTHSVIITGRRAVDREDLSFVQLDLSTDSISHKIEQLLEKSSLIDLVVCSAGYFQEGNLLSLHETAVEKMIRVGLTAPTLLIQKILRKQRLVPGLMVITSTSQWTPRPKEPVYTAVKAGMGMLANSLSLDGTISKTLVVGPSGMKTRFWEEDGRDTSAMLDAHWVAEQILQLWGGAFSYKFARILRGPARVETTETR